MPAPTRAHRPRGWSHDDASFTDDPGANPVVEGRMHKADCGPLTDGGAGVVLVSDRWLAAHPEHATARSSIRGWGHRTAGLALEEKLAKSAGDGLVFPMSPRPSAMPSIVRASRRSTTST